MIFTLVDNKNLLLLGIESIQERETYENNN